MIPGLKGNCYLCGMELGKTAMKNHLIKTHNDSDGGQKCYLLKVEGAYDKDYWLFIDVPVTAALSGVDRFLRKIWLECCGHMSAFLGHDHGQIGKNRKLNTFSISDKLVHEYDFGSTTTTLITIVGETMRKPQKESVRLLARNVPLDFPCASCGQPAWVICSECMYDSDNPFLCDACSETHEHEDMILTITNSPRMGECAYQGELDVFAFDALKFKTQS